MELKHCTSCGHCQEIHQQVQVWLGRKICLVDDCGCYDLDVKES